MNFEDVLDQEKNELTEALITFGEGKRVNKALADLEMNRPEFYKFYKAGQQSKQDEVNTLQKKIDALINFIDSDQLGHDARLGDFYRDIIDILK